MSEGGAQQEREGVLRRCHRHTRGVKRAPPSPCLPGNGEALNEPGLSAAGQGLAARGSTWIRLDAAAGKAAAGHAASLASAMPTQLLTAPLDATPPAWLAVPGRAATFSGVAPGAVPDSLSLMTVQSLGADSLLVRVQHVFEAGEGPMSGAWTVDGRAPAVFAPRS